MQLSFLFQLLNPLLYLPHLLGHGLRLPLERGQLVLPAEVLTRRQDGSRISLGESTAHATAAPHAPSHAAAPAQTATPSHPTAHTHTTTGHLRLLEWCGLTLRRAGCAGHAEMTGDVRLIGSTELTRLELLDYVSHDTAACDDHLDAHRGESLVRIGAPFSAIS
jgi:hypothetical protein